MTMNKKLYAALLSTLVSIPAFADMGNIYASGKIGWAWMEITDIDASSRFASLSASDPFRENSSDNVLAYGGAVGYQWNTFLIPVRMEVDYTYRNNLTYNSDFLFENDIDNQSRLTSTVQSQTVLGNVYLDLPLVQMFGLFVGGGAGVAFNTTQNTIVTPDPAFPSFESTTDEFDLAWMVTAGMSLTPTEWMAIDLSYRYSDLGSVLWSTQAFTEFSSNNFTSQDVFLTFRFTMPSEKRPPAQPLSFRPKAEPEPAPIPVTKSPAYKKPDTKAPAYVKPETKAPSYDAERARRVKKSGDVNRDK
jgi:opacity protein-like surface antigen